MEHEPAPRGPLTPPDAPSLVHALAYAARGWRVLRARQGSKIPDWHREERCQNDGPCSEGHIKWPQLATTDPETICEWWGPRPEDNICITTGEASNLWVLDIDDGPGKQGSASLAALEHAHRHEPLPPTWTVTTGSGGCHLYFTWEGVDFDLRNSAGRLGADLDTRGNGGQVVAPPSQALGEPGHHQSYGVIDTTAHTAAPGWLINLLRPRQAVAPTAAQSHPRTGQQGPGSAYGLAALAHATDRIRDCPENQGDHTIYVESLSMGQLIAGGELCDPQHVIAELRAALASWGWKRPGDDTTAHRKIETCVLEGMRRTPRTAPENPFRRGTTAGTFF